MDIESDAQVCTGYQKLGLLLDMDLDSQVHYLLDMDMDCLFHNLLNDLSF